MAEIYQTVSRISLYKPTAGHHNCGKCFTVIFGYSPSVEGFLVWCMAYPSLGVILLGSNGAARVFSSSRF